MLLGAGAQRWSLPTDTPFQFPMVHPVPTSATSGELPCPWDTRFGDSTFTYNVGPSDLTQDRRCNVFKELAVDWRNRDIHQGKVPDTAGRHLTGGEGVWEKWTKGCGDFKRSSNANSSHRFERLIPRILFLHKSCLYHLLRAKCINWSRPTPYFFYLLLIFSASLCLIFIITFECCYQLISSLTNICVAITVYGAPL